MNTARGILNGLLLSAVLWIAIMALACPVHAQDVPLLPDGSNTLSIRPGAERTQIATYSTCTRTLLACSDDHPDCNAVTCTKWSLDDLGKPQIERVPLPTPKPEHAMRKALPYVAWVACQSFDGITSAVALRNPQLREWNPILRGPALFPIKIAVNVGVFIGHQQIKAQYPKLTFFAPLVMASSGCLAGVLNTRTIRSVQ